MGHDSTRAALIYLHGSPGADRVIADALPVEFDETGLDPRHLARIVAREHRRGGEENVQMRSDRPPDLRRKGESG